MEPNNIENQIREKLNSRAIQPSENAWDRLDAMLTVVDKPKRNFRWMYFAASFLGFILIAAVFLSQTQEVIDSEHQKVVVQEKTSETEELILENTETKVVANEPTIIVSATQKVVEKQKNTKNSKSKRASSNENLAITEIATISQQKVVKKSISAREQSANWPSNQKTEVKVDANSLLASVDNFQPAAALPKKAVSIAVNTNQLLAQVDDELDLSFREKVIKSVNKKYKEVKVAVAKRNLE